MAFDPSKRISNLLPGQIPDYVQDFYPLFVVFITKYFEYLENTSAGVQYTIQNLQLNRDIDTAAADLTTRFLNTYVPNLPNYSSVDSTILIKHFRDFYQRKGTEESFQFFFRAFFGDSVELYYPKDNMFRTSAGTWHVERTLRVMSYVGDPQSLQNFQVQDQTTGAFADVESVNKIVGGGGANYYDLVLHNLSQDLLPTLAFTSGSVVAGTVWDYATDTSSTVAVISVDGVQVQPGRYLDTGSQLSSDQKLQDSYYYQLFSYVIRSHEDRETWIDHVLKHLHPTGLKLFNDYIDKQTVINQDSSTVAQVETSVKFPTIKSFLAQTNVYTFDRIAALYTGTSTTRIATGTSFTTVTYTSIGAISYTSSYTAYIGGENITWALQKDIDLIDTSVTVRQLSRLEGASFDKLKSTLVFDQQVVAWPSYVNSSIVVSRRTLGSSTLTAGTAITSFTTTTMTLPTLGNSSMILLVTWLKDTEGSSPLGESSNAVVVTFSSNVTVVPYFDDEVQRNYKRIALGRSLEYRGLSYTHSSNSISSSLVSGLPVSSSLVSGITKNSIIFKPYNWQRNLTYDRLAVRFEVDQLLQLNTSLTETFNTANITASGLISVWSSIATGASTSSFGSTTSTNLNFGRQAFVFNNGTDQKRYVQTINFGSTQRVDVSFDFVVGDNYNGGDSPEPTERLFVKASVDGGVSWPYYVGIWDPTNVWDRGTTSIGGKVFTQPGSTTLTGVGTTFLTAGYNIGDVVTVNSSLTTSYTITNILSNTIMTVTPAFVDVFRGNQLVAPGTVSGAAGTSTLTGSSTTWLSTLKFGDEFTLGTTSTAATAYTVLAITDDTHVNITPAIVGTTSGTQLYLITGVNGYYKIPVAQQFYSTSMTIIDNIASSNVIVQVGEEIEAGGGTTTNTDKYAIDNLTVSTWRYQSTTGTISIGVAVSSNSTLNISGNDFLDITTLGVG